jgi:hypothetical protein
MRPIPNLPNKPLKTDGKKLGNNYYKHLHPNY